VQTVAVSWFDECRYGMFVHANVATVPAFAPVHEYADWYWAFLEPKPDVVLHPTCPLPEVVAWHREQFGAQPYDDFIPELTFSAFDPDWYAQLLDDAGMRYLVHVTKHHDGFCWWDTAHTDRNSLKLGPQRDVVAELASAVRARGHVFGCYYSLLDWSHEAYPNQAEYVDAFMRPQIQELMERFEPAVLWGDGHWGHPGGHWRADNILGDARDYASAHGFEVVANDRFFASDPDFVTFEYDVPSVAPEKRWELCRGLGYSFCVNRNERAEDHLTAREIVAMLVETIAKGGNLLLNVGPNADGTVPAIQTQLLRESGEWVRAHADAIHGSQRFAVPGEGMHWYTRTGDVVHAFDLSSSDEPQFRELSGVTSVRSAAGAALPFRDDGDGVVVDARELDRHSFGTRYVVTCSGGHASVTIAAGERSLAARLAVANAGDLVDVAPGRYTDEDFPLVVPAGVTLRGLNASGVVIDAGGRIGVMLNEGARLEAVTVTGGAPGYMMIPPTCVVGNGDYITVNECHVESIALNGGADHVVTNNVIAGGKIWCIATNRSTIRGNYQHGLRWGAGIEMNGGSDHVIDNNECRDDLCAIRCTMTEDVEIVRNRYETRWFGIHLLDAQRSRLYRNQAWRTMRAVGIEGGAANRVEKQLAEHCDSGVMIERGAQHTIVTDCWLHDCRVGVFVWEAGDVETTGNAISDARDRDIWQ
jgi:alpha-L-fucosidase